MQTSINANNKSKRIYLVLKAACLITDNDKQNVTLHVFLAALLYYLQKAVAGKFSELITSHDSTATKTFRAEDGHARERNDESSFLLFV